MPFRRKSCAFSQIKYRSHEQYALDDLLRLNTTTFEEKYNAAGNGGKVGLLSKSIA